MHIRDICTSEAAHCTRDETVQGAALMMRRRHVGDVVVVDRLDGASVPVGILTDRDIVVSVIAPGLDPASLQVGDIMADDLLLAHVTDDVYGTIERMRQRGIRRVPVIDEQGNLAGIVSADDLFEFLAQEMAELSRISPYQQAHEKRARQ
ncbi:CBS domain-containing protein [Massilia sp. MS-15]|uniref:CBS domain-containing protein n=1 Tax=Massilia sp. MS-15 TaxID=2878200 RepID=UPI001CD588DC|nr:CBS domain-containing protein [Massilia sp. MS-15]MCA1246949.1 CBS domain-containing protein [Massilia sp. MS-15]